MVQKKKESVSKGAIAVVATAAVAAGALGAYFLYGTKKGTKKRKEVKAWMLKAKGEIMERLEKASEVSEDVYHKVVDEVSKEYSTVKGIDASDIAGWADEVKSYWKDVAKKFKAKK
jgi:hypothetical protein